MSRERVTKLDGAGDPIDKIQHLMADIIDLSLVAESRKTLQKLLDARGIAYFLRRDPRRPFQLEPEKVDLVVRTAAKLRHGKQPNAPAKPHARAYEHARKQIRRELIRRVVAEMIMTGL